MQGFQFCACTFFKYMYLHAHAAFVTYKQYAPENPFFTKKEYLLVSV